MRAWHGAGSSSLGSSGPMLVEQLRLLPSWLRAGSSTMQLPGSRCDPRNQVLRTGAVAAASLQYDTRWLAKYTTVLTLQAFPESGSNTIRRLLCAAVTWPRDPLAPHRSTARSAMCLGAPRPQRKRAPHVHCFSLMATVQFPRHGHRWRAAAEARRHRAVLRGFCRGR